MTSAIPENRIGLQSFPLEATDKEGELQSEMEIQVCFVPKESSQPAGASAAASKIQVLVRRNPWPLSEENWFELEPSKVRFRTPENASRPTTFKEQISMGRTSQAKYNREIDEIYSRDFHIRSLFDHFSAFATYFSELSYNETVEVDPPLLNELNQEDRERLTEALKTDNYVIDIDLATNYSNQAPLSSRAVKSLTIVLTP